MLFAKYMAQGDSYTKAYELSKLVGTDYVYINNDMVRTAMWRYWIDPAE